jgi:hypothetical protein
VVTCGSSGMSFLLVSSCRLAVSGYWLVSSLDAPPVALVHDGPLGDAGGGGGRGEPALKKCPEYLSRFSMEPSLLR